MDPSSAPLPGRWGRGRVNQEQRGRDMLENQPFQQGDSFVERYDSIATENLPALTSVRYNTRGRIRPGHRVRLDAVNLESHVFDGKYSGRQGSGIVSYKNDSFKLWIFPLEFYLLCFPLDFYCPSIYQLIKLEHSNRQDVWHDPPRLRLRTIQDTPCVV